jgi:hypothetical protein
LHPNSLNFGVLLAQKADYYVGFCGIIDQILATKDGVVLTMAVCSSCGAQSYPNEDYCRGCGKRGGSQFAPLSCEAQSNQSHITQQNAVIPVQKRNRTTIWTTVILNFLGCVWMSNHLGSPGIAMVLFVIAGGFAIATVSKPDLVSKIHGVLGIMLCPIVLFGAANSHY